MGFSIGGLLGSNSSAKKAAAIQQTYTKEQMMNQHQWEMEDLKAANLNPALTLGDTSGAHGSAGMPNMGGTPEGLSGLLNSAISAYTAKKDAETGETQGQLNLAQAGKTIAETQNLPKQLKNDTIRALAEQTIAEATKGEKEETTKTIKKRRKHGRLSELGEDIADSITDFFTPKTIKHPNTGKKVVRHSYGIRKNGK